MKPTEFIEWGERDRVLAEALIEFEDTAYCPGCGQLKSEAWDPASQGAWDYQTIHCYSCEHKDKQAKQNDDATPGELKVLAVDHKSVKISRARMKAREAGAAAQSTI